MFFLNETCRIGALRQHQQQHTEKGIRVNLCRFGLCLVGALDQVAVTSLGGLWPDVPTNHIPAPTMPAWTHSNPLVWCQTLIHTRAHRHAHTHAQHTGSHSSCKHCSQLQTWITTELTLCDPLPKQKDAPLYIQTRTRPRIYTTHTTHAQGGGVWVELSEVRF